MQSPFRNILTYNADVGHLYVKNQKARVRHPNGAYILKTDKHGYRNESTKSSSEIPTILFVGDSFTAGDGVTNTDRFSDILKTLGQCNVYNIGVSGYGVDQMLLAYSRIKNTIPHDIVVLAPHLDDLNRNMVSERLGIDKKTGKKIKFSKPFYTIENDALTLHNVPVPRSTDFVEESVSDTVRPHSAAKVALSKLKGKIIRTVKYRLLDQQNDSDITDQTSDKWKLMDALVQEFHSEVDGKPLYLIPLPEHEHVRDGLSPKYLDIFKRFEKLNKTHVMDVLPALKHANETNEVFLPSCGHFNPYAHKAVAQTIYNTLHNQGIVATSHETSPESNNQTPNYVLGISAFYHDSAATLLKDGEIFAAAQEERFTRIKHDKNFPDNAINYCLEEAEINMDQLAAVCYYDDETITLNRIMRSMGDAGDKSQHIFDTNKRGILQKVNLPGIIENKLGFSGPIFKTDHHRSHAASAFYPSPYQDAAIIVVDGVGEWATMTIAHGTSEGIKTLAEQHYPDSLGLLYSAVTYYCGFRVNSGEYKLMGLAPYGKPIYVDRLRDNVLEVFEDGSVQLNLDYFKYQFGEEMTNNALWLDTFGFPKRESESQITRPYMDMAASIQVLTEEVMLLIAKHAKALTNSNNVVLAGGVALNCVANGKLQKANIFENIWIQPAAGDAGGSLGAALEYYHSALNPVTVKHRVATVNSYYGPTFSDDEIESFLFSNGYPAHKMAASERGETIAEFLVQNNVVGHMNGRMEFGPRALGARSILGNSMDEDAQRKINLKIKYRESFRPFAPAVLEEDVSDYFEFDEPSPYMLMVAPVKKELCLEVEDTSETENMIEIVNQKRSTIPSITHVDYSARIQTVNKQDADVGFYDILSAFKEKTGCPVLINTSFNVRGEPIVCTPFDSYRCFMRTEMDVLVLGNFYLLKSEQPAFIEEGDWRNEFALD